MTRFAFIVHPLHISDVARKYSFTRHLPERWVEAALAVMSPQYCGKMTGIRSLTGAETEGWLVGCPLTARQLLNGNVEKATRKIVDACNLAASLGAEVVGLGAFTSIVGDKGLTIAERVEIGVTTGNSYTTATAIEGALLAAERMGHVAAESQAVILGATGSIGKICARMLAPQVGGLTLVGRRQDALAELAASIEAKGHVRAETDIAAALREADIVVAVTSAVEAVVEPEHLKPGAVVCDVARPRDVSRRVIEQRDDVLVIEGGAVAIPGPVECDFDFGFPPGMAYACMCETMILALEGRTGDYSLGSELKQEQVEEMAALGRKHGFTLGGFRSFERQLTDEDIERVRERAQARRA
ncbi:MAG: shikimate dehydrogenase [Armatimonadetes bacterium]|nr:shikimate dehydrogenase [Armatimonadota bacterium]